ncbi:MAG: S-layer homology domain-containing protein [Clostridia bacterium]|nr:S-layer homology domain-containing protein [Clostridia bacterium]
MYDGKTLTGNYDFSGLTITANKSALDLYEIVNVEMMKTAYPVGYRFTVDDIDFIQYTLSKNGSLKKLYSEDFDKYSEDIDLEVLTLNSRGNVTTKSSTSSYLRTIQEADVQTSSKGSKYVTLRVYVGDEDFDVDVSIGDLGGVSVYYGNTLLTYYEDIMEALDAIDEGDSALTSYSTRTSGTYNIRLGEDQKVTKNYSDYDPERYISIDLNGYNLTFYTTTIGVSSRNKYSVSVTNTSSTTSKFEYYDLDQTLLVDKGETLIFDSDLARDEVPGIYTVKIADTKNGKVTAKPEANKNTNAVTIAHGNDITFTITPDEGYQIDAVKLGSTTVSTTSTSNKDYTVNATTGVATYTMKNVIKDGQTLTATFKVIEKKEEPKAAWTNPFTDISTRATYYDDVRFVNQNGLMNGMTATTFSPSSNMTRAQFVTTLGRMYFSDYKTTEDKDAAVLRIYGTASEFKDVDYDNYNDRDIKYAIPYINWATANGLILGYGDGTFGPRDNITHQQMYIIMYRYATSLAKQTPNVSRVTLSIPDADKIGMTLVGGTWQYWTDAAREGALTAAKYAQQQQFLVSSGAMDPTGDAYRYELATLLHRFSVNVLGWKD